MRPGVHQPKAGGALERKPCRGAAGVAAEAGPNVSPMTPTTAAVASLPAGVQGVSCKSAQITHVDGSWIGRPRPSESSAGCTASCCPPDGNAWRSMRGAAANASVRAVISARHSRRMSERWVFNEFPLSPPNDTPFAPKRLVPARLIPRNQQRKPLLFLDHIVPLFKLLPRSEFRFGESTYSYQLLL
jgi:hypothetical protein